MPHPVPLRYVSNLTRISQEIGWGPQTGINDGLRLVF
jgi:dTDP-D-glucose 4,6-dehydratase